LECFVRLRFGWEWGWDSAGFAAAELVVAVVVVVDDDVAVVGELELDVVGELGGSVVSAVEFTSSSVMGCRQPRS